MLFGESNHAAISESEIYTLSKFHGMVREHCTGMGDTSHSATDEQWDLWQVM